MSDTKEKTFPDLVGTAFLLWHREWRSVATTSSRVGAADGWVVLDETPVVVTKQRNDVPGMFGSGLYTGLKARSANGTEFVRSWNSYPDDAHTGATLRWSHSDSAERVPHVDLVDAIQASSVFNRAIGGQYYDRAGAFMIPTGAEVCPRHGDTFLSGQPCESCVLDRSAAPRGREVLYIGCPFCSVVRPTRDRDKDLRGLHIRWDHPEQYLIWSAEGHDPNDWGALPQHTD